MTYGFDSRTHYQWKNKKRLTDKKVGRFFVSLSGQLSRMFKNFPSFCFVVSP